MSRQQWIYLTVVVALIGGTAVLLKQFKPQQSLGEPGVKYSPIADSIKVDIQLPEQVLDFTSEAIDADEVVVSMLPPDTSLAQRRYQALDGFGVTVNVVLMGTDRTSIHKPRFCLEGQGWAVDDKASSIETISIERPVPYDLPVLKLVATHGREVNVDGQTIRPRAVYVYWYVADGALSADASGLRRLWMMTRELMRGGPMQRWAYVSYLSVCVPGQEEATFERMKKMIAASVPEFQMTPRLESAEVAARQ